MVLEFFLNEVFLDLREHFEFHPFASKKSWKLKKKEYFIEEHNDRCFGKLKNQVIKGVSGESWQYDSVMIFRNCGFFQQILKKFFGNKSDLKKDFHRIKKIESLRWS